MAGIHAKDENANVRRGRCYKTLQTPHSHEMKTTYLPNELSM